ncbi:cytochrome P450 alkane hydroxylase [Hypoxylon cercidicola]|nr:cytochrome P450 alkane hydroxylase [Hypoxylon cercidicola]
MKELQQLAKKYDCAEPPSVKNRRLLGVDRLEQIFRANSESRLMEEFLFHFRQTGYTIRQVLLGITAYDTAEPANLEAILSSKFNDFGNGPRRAITFPMFGDGIFTQEGEAWKHSREILRPQMYHSQYENLDLFREPVDDLLAALPEHGGLVDLQPLFFRFTLDVSTAFLFGESVHSLKSPTDSKEKNFADAFNLAQKYVINRFRLSDFYWLIGGKAFRDACSQVHQFADEIIDRNLSKGNTDGDDDSRKRYVFLKSVARECHNRDALRGQTINVLAAGRDTTACVLSWVFFHLVRHPRVMKELRDEISQLPADDKIDRTYLRRLPYLNNVVKEILRLYPSVPINYRVATRNTVLPTGGGEDRSSPVLIPKGTAVAYSIYAMHRRPDLYGMDAEQFRPERWDEDLPMNRDPILQRWGYLPFNGGPRTCLGMDFALTEACYTIVRILQRYPTIKLPDGEKPELVGAEKQTMTLVLQITDGCKVEICR